MTPDRRESPLPLPFRARPAALALLMTAGALLAPQQGAAQGLAGAYLAAREAGARNDVAASLPYLERLFAADPASIGTLEGLAVGAFSIGAFDEALRHARALATLEADNRAAAMILLSQALVDRDYATALDIAQGGAQVHPLVAGLGRAWAHLGAGSMSDALAALDEVARIDGMRAFAEYCRALALAMVGDVEGAIAVIEDPEAGVSAALNRRGYIAYAQLLALNERTEDALTLIETVFQSGRDPQVERMRTAYTAGQALPFDVIATPAEGMAEVYAVMASAMNSARNQMEALIYAQAAVLVNPALAESRLMIGQIFEELEQPELAAAAYETIPSQGPFGNAAQMGRAQVLETLGRRDEAIAGLQAMADADPQSFVLHSVLGDFLRRDSQFAAAAGAYSRALEAMQAAGLDPDWQLWFSRAVSLARADDWPAAEADFRAALAIEPDQPTVLNYLGYSLVERHENLDEALEMIERAVAGDPTSGYILDSLAWALYRLGRHDEALPHMERAVEMEPTDAVLNDHLGDVYWAVGRQREARFQWRRALSFAPADDLDEGMLRRKLEVGLDEAQRERGGVAPGN